MPARLALWFAMFSLGSSFQFPMHSSYNLPPSTQRNCAIDLSSRGGSCAHSDSRFDRFVSHRRGCCRSLSVKNRDSEGENDDAHESLEVLRAAIDHLSENNIAAASLGVDQKKRLSTFAKSSSKSISPIQPSMLERGMVLVGRWKLALTTNFFWLEQIWPQHNIFLEIFDGGKINGSVFRFMVKQIFADFAGIEVALPFISNRSLGGEISTAYFDGDLWIEENGASVYRYEGEPATVSKFPSSTPPGPQKPWKRFIAESKQLWSKAWRLSAAVALTVAHVVLVLPTGLFLAVLGLIGSAFSRLVWQDSLEQSSTRPRPSMG